MLQNVVLPLAFDEEHYELYVQYQNKRHRNTNEDEEDIEKVLPDFIEMMIAKPRKRLMESLGDLKIAKKDDEYVVRLDQLIDEFLHGKKNVNKEIT